MIHNMSEANIQSIGAASVLRVKQGHGAVGALPAMNACSLLLDTTVLQASRYYKCVQSVVIQNSSAGI